MSTFSTTPFLDSIREEPLGTIMPSWQDDAGQTHHNYAQIFSKTVCLSPPNPVAQIASMRRCADIDLEYALAPNQLYGAHATIDHVLDGKDYEATFTGPSVMLKVRNDDAGAIFHELCRDTGGYFVAVEDFGNKYRRATNRCPLGLY